MPRKAPAFQCYASNLIADSHYRLMSITERAIWISMYLECWCNEKLPSDRYQLSKWLGFAFEDVKQGLSSNVLYFFNDDGQFIRCPELDDYRNELNERRKKQTQGGIKGARIKKEKSLGQPNSEPEGHLGEDSKDKDSKDKFLKSDVYLANSEWIDEFSSPTDSSSYRHASKGY
ncbi:MAG: hypothetical protein EBS31_06580 [Burkholderiaceae bacterium]|nr:hypothetical protein [Burkholderiaceae bacterium]